MALSKGSVYQSVSHLWQVGNSSGKTTGTRQTFSDASSNTPYISWLLEGFKSKRSESLFLVDFLPWISADFLPCNSLVNLKTCSGLHGFCSNGFDRFQLKDVLVETVLPRFKFVSWWLHSHVMWTSWLLPVQHFFCHPSHPFPLVSLGLCLVL